MSLGLAAAGAGGWYLDALRDHYYVTTAAQACLLVSAGDAFAQLAELRGEAARATDADAESHGNRRVETRAALSRIDAGADAAADAGAEAGAEADGSGMQRVAATGDESTSREPQRTYSWERTARMGGLGLLIGGLGTAAWLRQLERTLPLREVRTAHW